jgi:hypothetical protein
MSVEGRRLQVRWLVRRETAGDLALGEHARARLRWAVRRALVRFEPGKRPRRIDVRTPTFFESLRAAHDYATREAEAHYGRRGTR